MPDILARMPLRRSDVRLEQLPDQSAVLFVPHTAALYAISATAAQVWSRCDGGTSVRSIIQELVALYDAPEPVLRQDVLRFIDSLTGTGLLIDGAAVAPGRGAA